MAVKEISVAQFLKKPKEIKPGSVIVIYGEEELLHRRFLEFLKNHFGEYQFFHGEDIDLDDLKGILGMKTLFGGGKSEVKVLWRAQDFLSKLRRKQQKEKLKKVLNSKFTNIVVFSLLKDLKKSDLSKEPYKGLFERADLILTAKNLNRQQIALMVKQKFLKAGIKIPENAVRYILENFSSLVELKNELEKLITYAQGKEKITLEEIKSLLAGNPQYTVFDFQNAFFGKELKKSLHILEALKQGLTQYERTALMFQLEGLILNTTNRLLIAKERTKKGEELKTFARDIGLYYPFQVKQLENWLNLWEEKELINLLRELYRFDLSVKTKFLPAEEEFKKVVLSVLGK